MKTIILCYMHLHYVAVYAKRVEKKVHAFQKWPIHNKVLSGRPFRANSSLTQQKIIFTSSNLPSFSPQKLLRCLSTLFGKEDDLLCSAVLLYCLGLLYYRYSPTNCDLLCWSSAGIQIQ